LALSRRSPQQSPPDGKKSPSDVVPNPGGGKDLIARDGIAKLARTGLPAYESFTSIIAVVRA
jgi:hypothetical protein